MDCEEQRSRLRGRGKNNRETKISQTKKTKELPLIPVIARVGEYENGR